MTIENLRRSGTVRPDQHAEETHSSKVPTPHDQPTFTKPHPTLKRLLVQDRAQRSEHVTVFASTPAGKPNSVQARKLHELKENQARERLVADSPETHRALEASHARQIRGVILGPSVEVAERIVKAYEKYDSALAAFKDNQHAPQEVQDPLFKASQQAGMAVHAELRAMVEILAKKANGDLAMFFRAIEALHTRGVHPRAVLGVAVSATHLLARGKMKVPKEDLPRITDLATRTVKDALEVAGAEPSKDAAADTMRFINDTREKLGLTRL
jgi:hypothetical protein